MNSFDAAVYVFVIVAAVAGFNAGLLRSLATILAYLCALPAALAVTPRISPLIADRLDAPWAQSWLVFVAAFVGTGLVLGALLRLAVKETAGSGFGPLDRLLGAMFGVIRVLLVAVTVVLVFDLIIPVNRQPAFLQGSQLRPFLSVAGQAGLKSLPSDVTAFIDQLKRERRI